jgi:hypothetical protein
MRLNDSDIVCASELTSSVLARPGTPTSRQWPREKIAIIISSITSSMPTMILRSSLTIASRASPSRSTAWMSASCMVSVCIRYLN